MKNLKILIVGFILFASFGFALINTDNDNKKIQTETEVAAVEINSRFSDDTDAFN